MPTKVAIGPALPLGVATDARDCIAHVLGGLPPVSAAHECPTVALGPPSIDIVGAMGKGATAAYNAAGVAADVLLAAIDRLSMDPGHHADPVDVV